MTGPPLVTVIVPAFNAGRTIDETLRSVREQTHRNLEILVVDDGSTDDTASKVQAHARVDTRVRLIQQANEGVASARNRAFAQAKADFIAPIDADDLWLPTKVEKQLDVMLSRGPRCGLVYTWQASIDEQGIVISTGRRQDAEGDVLQGMLFENILGSASSALMRKQAMIEAGGYDASLRQQGAQGCEDFKLYVQIAERYEYGLVREYLTGYRQRAGAMSMDLLQMQRSYNLVAEYAQSAHPEFRRLIRSGRLNYARYLFLIAIRHLDYRSGAVLLRQLLTMNPLYTLRIFLRLPYIAARSAARRLRARLDPKAHGPVRFSASLNSHMNIKEGSVLET